MFKSLAGKALVPVGLAVTGFVVVCFLLLYTAIKNVIVNDAVGYATNLADTILKSTRYAMLKSDRETHATIIKNIGEQKGVEHIRIFNKKGVVSFSNHPEELNRQVDKQAEGCIGCHAGKTPITTLGKMEQVRSFKNKSGTDVMAITTPIYNDPECANASCHFHPPSQKVLGILDIGLSQEMMIATLTSIRYEMILFSLMVLVLTVSGVTALLRRSVFVPMQRLRNTVEQLQTEERGTGPQEHFPAELDSIAKSYYNLSRQLQDARSVIAKLRESSGQRQ